MFDFDFGNAATGVHIDPTINLGDTVEWHWINGFHSVTSVSGIAESFNSQLQAPNFTFQHTFTHTGTFWYYCTAHGFDLGGGTAGGMSGKVNVVPEPASLMGLGIAALAALRKFRQKAR